MKTIHFNLSGFIKKSVVIFAVITFGYNTNLHGQHYRLHIFPELTPEFTNPDSALQVLNQYYLTAENSPDTIAMLKCLISMGSIYRYNLQFEKSFESSGEAVFLSEQYNNAYLKALAHEEFGILHHSFFQDEDASFHFKKSLQNYRFAYETGAVEKSELFQPYYYLFLNGMRTENKATAPIYLDSCRQILQETTLDKINKVYLNFGEAEYLFRDKEYIKAQKLLIEAQKLLEILPQKNTGATHKNFLTIIYFGLARIESALGNIPKAIAHIEKALADNILSNEFIFFQAFARSSYANLLEQSGDFENAYKQVLISKQIHEQYLNPRNLRSQGFLSVTNPYLEELQKKDREISKQRIALAEKKQEVFRIRIILAILIGFIVIVAIILWSRLKEIKHRKQMQISKELLEHKNKELTANMLQLIEKEDIIQKLSEYIRKPEQASASLSYLKNLEKNSGSLWEEFNSRFVELNSDFYEKLQKKVPNLTPLELKISALLKLNFSGKEMAYLLGMSLNSVNVARSRLRKKLDLDRETNLTGFINSI